MIQRDADVLLVGAGLANGLIALQLARRRPGLRISLIDPTGLDAAEAHTWCAFQSDVEPCLWAEVEPLLEGRWSRYEVSFPARKRRLDTAYGCLTGSSLAAALRSAPQISLVEAPARRLEVEAVVLEDGSRICAPLVIDGRGARPSTRIKLGYQKFVGLELALKRPHGLVHPIVMDAAVAQEGGYRFIYVIPLGPDRLLVEDTRYADTPDLQVPALETAVLRYARARRWMVGQILRREQGVLPVALDGDVDGYFAELDNPCAQVGLRGLFFHPTTGYSLPDGLAVAASVVGFADLTTRAVAEALEARSRRLWRERGFYRLLNRMLFLAARPDERYRVLERFYGLSQPLIERFYAARSSFADKARILSGRPPVPLWRAIKAAPPARRSSHVHA